MIETSASVARRHIIRTGRLIVVSTTLAVFVVVYRFNMLGGALGGFDTDHFVHFAYAKQVQAGEQPLRDFTGVGLQGVRPSLTYELSAWAQSLLGNNLRSEALLTVGGIAIGAVLTLVASAFVAPLWLALGATLSGIFFAPTLQDYPKVLVLAAGAVTIACHARVPTSRTIVALAAVTAAAFLFRHDYAVYVGLGAATVCLASGGLRRGVMHAAAYVALTLLLLGPSLWYVQRHVGLRAYFQESITQSHREVERTAVRWPTFTRTDESGRPAEWDTFFGVERNAVSFLYYAHLTLPVLILLALWRTRLIPWPEARPALGAIAIMAALVTPLFLRGNVAARFGDVAPLFSLLLAGACAMAVRRADSSHVAWLARVALLAVLLAAIAQSVWVVGGVSSELDASGWSDSPEKVTRQLRRRWLELAALPAAFWNGSAASERIAAVQYLHRCTKPDDRVLILSYQPELLPLADRRFAGGRASVVPGLLTDEAHQRALVDRWRTQSVPLVLVEHDEQDEQYGKEIPLIHAFLTANYADAGRLDIDGDVVLRVFARRGLKSSAASRGRLPCFR